MEIEIGKGAREKGISIATGTIHDVSVKETNREVFDLLMDIVKIEYRERFGKLRNLGSNQRIRAYRNLYWKIGIDPTKTRPSSEALIRRSFRKGIPLINNVVDAGNLASARTMIPVGLYDIDRIDEPLSLVLSDGGETFRGIGGKDEILDKGIPVLRDVSGVIHIYPHRDCMRTRITEDTRDVLVVACGVKGIREKVLNETIDMVDHYIGELGGR